MNFDSNPNGKAAKSLMTNSSPQIGRSKEVEEVESNFVNQLKLMLNSDLFHDVAQKTIKSVDNAEILAECAELISKKARGGFYYQSKFWAKIISLEKKNKRNKIAFNDLCKRVNVSPSYARRLAEFGEQLKSFEKKNKNGKTLQIAPNKILLTAKRQKGKTDKYLSISSKILTENKDATPNQIHKQWCQINGSYKANLDIIKPSDWWAFSHPKWRKEVDFDGSIPGEVYANSLYYFAPRNGIAADVMAGSGMLKRVYDDRKLWQKDSEYNLEIQLFDINPKRDFISKHDARKPLRKKVDWIFIDPPYFGQSKHLFAGDLSETENYDEYLELLKQVISAMSKSLKLKGRLCIFLPKWSGLTPELPNFNIPNDVCQLVNKFDLRWIDTAFVSRGRQQEPGSAMKNISAKRNRRMRSDTCVLNVFEKMGKS